MAADVTHSRTVADLATADVQTLLLQFHLLYLERRHLADASSPAIKDGLASRAYFLCASNHEAGSTR